MAVTLPDLIDPFYQPVGGNHRQDFVRGQLFFAPIGYLRENLELWRPTAYDATQTKASAFMPVAAPGDRFARAAPLHDPRLETNEEFLVVRGKKRPVILLNRAPADPGVARVRGAGRVYRRLAVVVPVFSLVHPVTGQLKFPQEFVDRLKILSYPEFLFLPTYAGVLRLPSFARVQEITGTYEPHLEPCDLRLADEALEILQDQVRSLVTGQYGGAFAAYREQLMNPEQSS